MLLAPLLPAARIGGRPRSTDLRGVVNAIFYLLRTGCQWRLLPRCFPPWGTVYHYFRLWLGKGVWVRLHRAVYTRARLAAGRNACPSVVIMDGQSVKTTELGGSRGFDAHKRVKGRKRHILVDTLGLLVTSRCEPAGISDRRAGERLVCGFGAALAQDPNDYRRCRPRKPPAGPRTEAIRGLEPRDHEARAARLQNHRSNLDRGAQFCMARPLSAAQQGL